MKINKLNKIESIANEGIVALTSVLPDNLITYFTPEHEGEVTKYKLVSLTKNDGLRYVLNQRQKNKILDALEVENAEIILTENKEHLWIINATFTELELKKMVKNLKPIIDYYNRHYYDGY
jgi:hypothetical protein